MKGDKMTGTDRMAQRAQLEIMLRDFTKEDRTIIMNNIEELKAILGTEDISKETLGVLILLYKKNKQ